jgi:hypothetical protein
MSVGMLVLLGSGVMNCPEVVMVSGAGDFPTGVKVIIWSLK